MDYSAKRISSLGNSVSITNFLFLIFFSFTLKYYFHRLSTFNHFFSLFLFICLFSFWLFICLQWKCGCERFNGIEWNCQQMVLVRKHFRWKIYYFSSPLKETNLKKRRLYVVSSISTVYRVRTVQMRSHILIMRDYEQSFIFRSIFGFQALFRQFFLTEFRLNEVKETNFRRKRCLYTKYTNNFDWERNETIKCEHFLRWTKQFSRRDYVFAFCTNFYTVEHQSRIFVVQSDEMCANRGRDIFFFFVHINWKGTTHDTIKQHFSFKRWTSKVNKLVLNSFIAPCTWHLFTFK